MSQPAMSQPTMSQTTRNLVPEWQIVQQMPATEKSLFNGRVMESDPFLRALSKRTNASLSPWDVNLLSTPNPKSVESMVEDIRRSLKQDESKKVDQLKQSVLNLENKLSVLQGLSVSQPSPKSKSSEMLLSSIPVFTGDNKISIKE